MSFALVILVAVCLLFPLGIAWQIWRLDEKTAAGWLVSIAVACILFLLILIVGRWDVVGHYTRLPLLALFAAAVVASGRRHAGRPWSHPDGLPLWRSHLSGVAALVIFGAGGAYIATGLLAGPAPVPLAFPLEGGRFMVVQGGGNSFLNHHARHPAQRRAADIVALNLFGFRAAGLAPADPADYAVYGAAVVSPCAGEVRETRDGLPDLWPPETDPENAAGNHVVIACDGLLVELAHLQPDSIAVVAGDRVQAGQRLGAVGNSGNTTEPHLHIHAVDAAAGMGVEMSFDGRVPVRNRIYARPLR